MKTFTALSAAALLAFAVPAVAQTTTQPNGTAGATSGTDTKGGSATSGMTEGRSSVNDPKMKAGGKDNAMKNGEMGTTGTSNNNMAPGGGPGDAGGSSK
jgi:hypothetical protein